MDVKDKQGGDSDICIDGAPLGAVVIHPHNNGAYIFTGHEWEVIITPEEQEAQDNYAYERAMVGI